MTVCGKYAPTSVTPSTSTMNSDSSKIPPGGVTPSDGYHSRTIAAHEPDGTTTAS